MPLVTLVVACLDEAATIEVCLMSILRQDYPPDRLEILVYDGGSTDRTVEIAIRTLAGHPRSAVRRNPRRIQSAAWNLGIASAEGDVVGIMSGHSEIDVAYVRTAVATLERTGADMVGGPVRAIGESRTAQAIALVTTTSFGAGGARFRLTSREEEVDTVFMGLAHRETYRRFPFDEEMVRDQDDELSYRLLDAGGHIVCNPSIGSVYRSRATIGGLARQYFAYGYWKVRVLQLHPGQARLRHLIPAVFVTGLTASVALLAWPGVGRIAGVAVLMSYGAANAVATITATRGRPRLALLAPIAYATLHVSYGAGFIAGMVRFRDRWQRGAPETIARALMGKPRAPSGLEDDRQSGSSELRGGTSVR